MRICTNSNPRLEQFNATFFAKEWIKKGHMRSDDTTKQRKKTQSTQTPVLEMEIPFDREPDESFDPDDIEVISASSSSTEICSSPEKQPRLYEHDDLEDIDDV